MAKKQSNFEKRINEFARVTFLTEDGKPKSAVWLYAFMLSILFGVFYLGIYLGAGTLLGKIWENGSVWALLLQMLATAVLGGALSLAFCLVFRGPRRCFVYYAYIWLAILLGMMFLTTLFMCDWKGGEGWIDLWSFCVLLYVPSILSILSGGLIARFLWKRELRRKEEAEAAAKARPSYYNS